MSDLSERELERYARHIVLPELGGLGQRRLAQARIAVIGAGGIGSAAIPALTGAGVGRMTIIDDDLLDRSNLQRQTIFRDDQVGEPKAPLAAEFARALNPDIEAVPRQERIDAGNAAAVLDGHDLVLDGCDNFATRLAVSDAATRLRLPLVSAAAMQFQGQVGLFRGWEDGQPCYRCFVGDAFDNDDCDTCVEQGVLGAVTGIAGSLAALLAIRVIALQASDDAGKLYLFDGRTLNLRRISIPKEDKCRACGRGNEASP